MDLLKISDFCRKYKLPQHRFTRYKRLFHTEKKDGYKVPWVKVDEWNLAMVADILQHTGTRRRKDRLTLDDFCRKYELTGKLFKKVCHRMQIEDHNGELMVVDSKHNYALLKHGRLIRKKT
jgi:hypothetical protein